MTELYREEPFTIFSFFYHKSHMKTEWASWNKTVGYKFVALVDLKPQFST